MQDTRMPEVTGFFSVEAESSINASLEQVWSVLADLKKYPEWNTFVPGMESSFKVGELLTMQVQMSKKRRVVSVETITAIEPEHLLAWRSRTPRWFLGAERFQVITKIDEQITQYWTREAFSGICAPLLKLMLGQDLQRGFNAVARDLKARVEAVNARASKDRMA